jgi:hypothetical protein
VVKRLAGAAARRGGLAELDCQYYCNAGDARSKSDAVGPKRVRSAQPQLEVARPRLSGQSFLLRMKRHLPNQTPDLFGDLSDLTLLRWQSRLESEAAG